mgnify:CR=1 FL=1
MGSRGASANGSKVPSGWQLVDYFYGIPILRPTNQKQSLSLPSKSNMPGVAYLLYDRKDNFKQLRIFGDNMQPVLDIDYHMKDGKMSLHKHNYINGIRQHEHISLTDDEYNEYSKFLTR